MARSRTASVSTFGTGGGSHLRPAPGTMADVDRDLRDWLRSLAVRHDDRDLTQPQHELNDEDAAYLERIARDGTLAAALAEIAATEPELAG